MKIPIKMDDLGGNTPIFGNTHILVNRHPKTHTIKHGIYLRPRPIWVSPTGCRRESRDKVGPKAMTELVIKICHTMKLFQTVLHHRKIPKTNESPLKRDQFYRKYIFQPLIFMGHVSFPGVKLIVEVGDSLSSLQTLGRQPTAPIVSIGWFSGRLQQGQIDL